jgi:hypothetical protein
VIKCCHHLSLSHQQLNFQWVTFCLSWLLHKHYYYALISTQVGSTTCIFPVDDVSLFLGTYCIMFVTSLFPWVRALLWQTQNQAHFLHLLCWRHSLY